MPRSVRSANAGNGATELAAGGVNAIGVANGIVGDEWTLWIVQMALNEGITQYKEWQHAGPISSSVLTARLAMLVELEVLERVQYNSRPPRHEYRLTARGRQMWPILLTMWAWERRWVNEPDEHLPLMLHTRCGEYFAPQLVCEACNEPAEARDVKGVFGPSGSWERSIPSAVTRRRSHSGARPEELVTHTMVLVGNRWSVALLGAAFMGATRFRDFEQRLGAPPMIVADRLRTFYELGVLEQSPNPQRPDWVVYHLTAKGRAFWPVVASVIDWAQRWFVAPEGPAIKQTHKDCGRTFRARLICDQCGERLRGSTVQVVRNAEEQADTA